MGYGDEPAGFLEPQGEYLGFSYTPAWREGPGPAVSLTLPKEGAAFQKRAHRFFANLLFEGEVSSLLARESGCPREDIFTLLAEYGRDTAGALSIRPEEEAGPAWSLTGEGKTDRLRGRHYIDVTGALAEILAIPADKRPPLLYALRNRGFRPRLTLAGAQDKLPIHYAGGRSFIPAPDSDSTTDWILKPDSPRFGFLPHNEAFCLKLAGLAGLPAATAVLQEFGGGLALLVRRYDRLDEAGLSRLHQEDFCQALGMAPEVKYQYQLGPGFESCVDLLMSGRAGEPEKNRDLLVKAAVFNYLIGNCDAHGKNFSILYDHLNRPGPAPFYDLVSTRVYPELTEDFAMRYGANEYNFHKISIFDWRNLARTFRLKPARLADLMEETTAAVQRTAPGLLDKEARERPEAERLYGLLERVLDEGLKKLAPMPERLRKGRA